MLFKVFKQLFYPFFLGLRGAISYALSLHLEFSAETRHVIITTTLIIVLFTTLIFGGSTMPLLKVLLYHQFILCFYGIEKFYYYLSLLLFSLITALKYTNNICEIIFSGWILV